MKTINALRQTGRTSRMLERATNCGVESKQPVYVIMSNQAEIDSVPPQFGSLSYSGVVLIPLNKASGLIDVETLKPLKESEGKIIFIDHGVVESKFQYLVNLLHDYDGSFRFPMSDVDGVTVNNDDGNCGPYSQTLSVKLK